MPFVAEKVVEMLNKVLSFAAEETKPVPVSEEKQRLQMKKSKRNVILRDKIRAMTKLMRFYHIIQKENENIVKLKALSPSGRLPAGILAKGSAAIADAVSSFTEAQKADKLNMQLPGTVKNEIDNTKQFGFRTRMGLE